MSNLGYFTEKFKTKSKDELQTVIDNPSNYQADAVEAAKKCLADLGEYVVEETEESESEVVAVNTSSRDVLIVSRQMRLIHFLIDHYVIQLVTLASMQLINFSYSFTGLYKQTYYVTSMIAPLDIYNYFIMFFLYYFLFEHFGQVTIGKMITRTIVVDEMGYKPSVSESLIRSLSRFIPFEPFSCLVKPSRGWHDKFSSTYVIEQRNLERFRNWNKEKSVDEHLITD